MRPTTAELNISEGDYTEAGKKLLRRHDDPDIQPESTWNQITTPGPGKFYERYWRYEIDEEDQYPAYRGHDTPATRAMRFAVDTARPWTKFFFDLRIAAHPRKRRPEPVPPKPARPEGQETPTFEELLWEMNYGMAHKSAEEEKAEKFQEIRGQEVALNLFRRQANLHDVAMHLMYLGFRYGDSDAVADGISMMEKTKDFTLRLMAKPCLYESRNVLEQFIELRRSGVSIGGVRHSQEIGNAAAAAAISDEFCRLTRLERPPYDPDKAPHPLEDAVRSMHERAFRFHKDGIYRELCRTLAGRKDADSIRTAIEEVRQYSRDLNRLHQEAETAAEDAELWSQYRQVRDEGTRKERQQWLDGRIDRLCRMDAPKSLTGWMLWKRAVRNFHMPPDNPQSGLSLTWAIRENAFLLPLLRKKETALLFALRNGHPEPGQ